MANEAQNWRIETNAADYFGHRKKAAEVEGRRPVIRKASDLVGPGVGAEATRITDFNDVLARFNGFFSALPGAANEPTTAAPVPVGFVGFVSSDPELGGVQLFTDLANGDRFQRVFLRSPYDPDAITWQPWVAL